MNGDKRWSFLLVSLVLTLAFSFAAAGQAAQKPVFAGYKGVMIGTKMDDARTKLGTPKDKSDSEDYYVYSDNESAQVLYGPDKSVRVLSVNYMGKGAPTPMEVLGLAVDATADGGIY